MYEPKAGMYQAKVDKAATGGGLSLTLPPAFLTQS